MLALHDPNERLNRHDRLWMPQPQVGSDCLPLAWHTLWALL